MKKLKETWAKMPNWGKITTVVIALAIFGALLPEDEPAAKPKAWELMTEPERIVWRANVLDHARPIDLSVEIEDAIMNQLLDADADIDLLTGLQNGQRSSAEFPHVEYFGTGKAKTPFGVRVKIRWRAEIAVYPTHQEVVSVKVL